MTLRLGPYDFGRSAGTPALMNQDTKPFLGLGAGSPIMPS